MNKKQLRRDYEITDYLDEKGKVRSKVRYRGATYSPVGDDKHYRLFCICYAVLTALSLATFVVPLCFNCNALRTIYFTMPFVLQVIPLFLLTIGAYQVVVKPTPYREEIYASAIKRAGGAAIAGTALAVVSVVCFAVFASLKGAGGLDYVAMGCSIGLCVLFAVLWLLFKRQSFNRSEPEPLPASDTDTADGKSEQQEEVDVVSDNEEI